MPPTTPATPSLARGDGGPGFGAAYARLRADIADSVHNGFAHLTSAQPAVLLAGLLGPAQTPLASTAADAAQRNDFLARIAPWAEQAAARLGISSDLVAAHAALESGWGAHPVGGSDGSGHNLFGLKAGADWRGASSDAATHEYLGGTMQQMVQRFRSYGDEASAFLDYANVLQAPRYASARNIGDDAAAFARALVHGGYATDPAYAQKLLKVVDTVRGMRQR